MSRPQVFGPILFEVWKYLEYWLFILKMGFSHYKGLEKPMDRGSEFYTRCWMWIYVLSIFRRVPIRWAKRGIAASFCRAIEVEEFDLGGKYIARSLGDISPTVGHGVEVLCDKVQHLRILRNLFKE